MFRVASRVAAFNCLILMPHSVWSLGCVPHLTSQFTCHWHWTSTLRNIYRFCIASCFVSLSLVLPFSVACTLISRSISSLGLYRHCSLHAKIWQMKHPHYRVSRKSSSFTSNMLIIYTICQVNSGSLQWEQWIYFNIQQLVFSVVSLSLTFWLPKLHLYFWSPLNILSVFLVSA